MTTGDKPEGLKLTEDEACALLGLCLTSPMGLDTNSERALRKLAEFCSQNSNLYHRSIPPHLLPREQKLEKAGA